MYREGRHKRNLVYTENENGYRIPGYFNTKGCRRNSMKMDFLLCAGSEERMIIMFS